MNRIFSLVTGLVALLALGSCDSDADTSTPAPAPAVETAPAVEAPSKPKMGALQFVKAFSQALRTRWIEIGVHESQERGPALSWSCR